MEAKASKSSQIIDIIADVQGGVPGIGGNKICPGTTCDFSDSAASSKDANERNTSIRKLLFVVILCIIFMSVEVVGGMKANSLAILTDAAHLLTDVAAFAISLISIWASGWEATPRQSYGFFRLEILGALVSIQSIWLITGILVYQAIERLIYGSGEVQGVLMFAVAAFGLIVNIIMAIFLGHDHDAHGHGHGHSHGNHGHGHHPKDHGSDHAHVMEHGHSSVISITTHHHHSKDGKHTEKCEPLLNKSKDAPNENTDSRGTKLKQRNINVHSAYLHVLGDCIQSAGVMIGGAIIWYKPQWKVIDLVCTLIFSFIVLLTTIKMLRNILEVLMESTPREIDATRIEKGLCELDGVVAIHELHIWAITVGKVILACHVTITPEADADLVLDKVIRYIKREYNISHVTIQIERQ